MTLKRQGEGGGGGGGGGKGWLARQLLRWFSCHGLHLVDPRLVHVRRTGEEDNVLRGQYLLDQGAQKVPQCVLTAHTSVCVCVCVCVCDAWFRIVM